MKKLKIVQNNVQEKTKDSVVEKLYALTKSDDTTPAIAESAELEGNVRVDAAYEDSVTYLRNKFPNLTIDVTDNNYYIRFADKEVERVLLENGVGNGVGITKTDARRTNVKQWFRENKTITSFDEFEWFDNENIGNDAFRGCEHLRSIYLTNTKTIGHRAFWWCPNLSGTLSLPNLTSNLGEAAFRETGIQKIENLNGTNLPNWGTFFKCQNLTEANLGDTISIIGNNIFYECSKLATVNLPETIIKIGDGAFKSTKINNDINLPNLVSLGAFAFENTLVKNVVNIGTITEYNNCFGNTPITKLTLPETVTRIERINNSQLTQLNFVPENITYLGTVAIKAPAAKLNVLNFCNVTTAVQKLFNITVNQCYMPKITKGVESGYYSNYTYNTPFFSLDRIKDSFTCGLLYLKDMSILYPATFTNSKITNLVINNETPPEWRNTNNISDDQANNEQKKSLVFIDSDVSNIYVPDAAVTTYRQDENWQSVADKIKPLSELPSVNTKTEYDQLSDVNKLNTIIKEYM